MIEPSSVDTGAADTAGAHTGAVHTGAVHTGAAHRGARRPRHSRLPLPPGPLAGFLIAVLAVALIALFTYRALQESAATAADVANSDAVVAQMQALLSSAKDIESGERGYLITGDETYLEPFRLGSVSLPGELKVARQLTSDQPDQLRRLDTLETLLTRKQAEIERTIALSRSGDAKAAVAEIKTGLGKDLMDRIRSEVAALQQSARALLADREAEHQEATRLTYLVTGIGSAVLIILIFAASAMTSRDYRARESQAWLRSGHAELTGRIQGEQRLEKLGSHVLEFLAEYLGACVGALFVAEGAVLRRVAGYAIPPSQTEGVLRPGDGLLGQAAKENRTLQIRDVPPGYLSVASSLGAGESRELLLAPASVDGVAHGVVELGFFRRTRPSDLELLARVSESLGVAVRASKDRMRLEELLAQTQRQAEELQTQQEELRVGNEELQVQARALKESQLRLESQQAELEQTNSQLEEQQQMLEAQRDELERAQSVLAEKAAELERTNQYKSEFLANMSHELRTPLNSTLILAKLLADNKAGNLTEEQVKFAQTISSAGNELLALINDILDLSRIEAGRLAVEPQDVPLARTVESLTQTFRPLAAQRKLEFEADIAPGTPPELITDPLRLGQILRNLLSNALKFTEAGKVQLKVAAADPGHVSFTVQDTGIGIAEHQQALIFEAFRQADGSTHRKYGGSGLGLSISRDLARMLGGEISLTSSPGRGSTFTLTLPRVYTARTESPVARRSDLNGAAAPISPTPPTPGIRPLTATAAGAAAPRPVEMGDDREDLPAGSRILLVVEDDVRFATILRDLAHEMGFRCVVTHFANDALLAALTYHPNAILLDINLPDHSGLGVLDQLKHDPRTRHIPVHVASVADLSHEALELGAIGYALKPVKREELVQALHLLEAKFSQQVRRVLVVEDDARQRDSIEQLLVNDDVQITGVETAGEAFVRLQETTFDCVVMDLNLPDLSGYELLEKMARQDDVSFPPVIVYTGRALSRDEEQKLRRYSRSIIIKDARSPERLLDEVTLFLHQVESELPTERQRMLKAARDRETILDGRRVLVVEDDARNIFALSSLLEPKGIRIEIARNGREALEVLSRSMGHSDTAIDLVLMDIMMPEMDGLSAMREIRKRSEWQRLPIIALTAKARKDDQDKCLEAGANDYIAKPLDVEKLLSLVRVWMPR